ncbi:hypothetical protein ACFL1H_00225 [Nanoarchaeota archaeon]
MKGQGLSLNTIVIAALVLIVLVVLGIMLGSQLGMFGTGVNDATGGGTCKDTVVEKIPRGETFANVCGDECQIKAFDCVDVDGYNIEYNKQVEKNGYACCVKIS